MAKRSSARSKATSGAKSKPKQQRRKPVQEAPESSSDASNIAPVNGEPVATTEGVDIKTEIEDTHPNNATDKDATTNGAPASSKKHPSPGPLNGPEGSSSKKIRSSSQASAKDDGNDGDSHSPRTPRFPSPPEEQATELDKQTWQGFCEIESDPAFFSSMVREMGAGAVTVKEVFALEPELLSMLPQPIYGLILLFRARQVAQADQESSCPANVWFANQMPAQNSCATLAMINILLNIKDVDIGPHLQQFKEFTQPFSPFQRGQTLSSWEFVKRIHNSYAKKMDMLEDDKYMQYKVQNEKKHKSRRPSQDSIATNDSGAEKFEENAHHFIAVVPIDGDVWKLDGMDAYPTNLGSIDDENGHDWLSIASATVNDVMMKGGDADYSIVALAQAPLAALRKELCTNIAQYQRTRLRLNDLDKDWSAFLVEGETATTAPPSPVMLEAIGVTQSMVDSTEIDATIQKNIDSEDLEELLTRRTRYIAEQNDLRNSIVLAMSDEAEEDKKSAERRWDYGPVIKLWLEMLAENGFLEEHLDDFLDEKPKAAADGAGAKGKGKAKKK